MTGEIRLVVESDAPAICAIYAPYVEETVISFETTSPSEEEIVARIRKTIGKFPWLVYVTGSQIAGYVYASAHRERAAYQWSVDVSVYVLPQFQRRNIGRGLYTALFALLSAQGYVNAYAGITLPNTASVAIHEAMGFRPIGVYKEVGYKFGAWHDVGWWALRLGELRDKPLPPRPIGDFVNSDRWSSAIQHGLSLIR